MTVVLFRDTWLCFKVASLQIGSSVAIGALRRQQEVKFAWEVV